MVAVGSHFVELVGKEPDAWLAWVGFQHLLPGIVAVGAPPLGGQELGRGAGAVVAQPDKEGEGSGRVGQASPHGLEGQFAQGGGLASPRFAQQNEAVQGLAVLVGGLFHGLGQVIEAGPFLKATVGAAARQGAQAEALAQVDSQGHVAWQDLSPGSLFQEAGQFLQVGLKQGRRSGPGARSSDTASAARAWRMRWSSSATWGTA